MPSSTSPKRGGPGSGPIAPGRDHGGRDDRGGGGGGGGGDGDGGLVKVAFARNQVEAEMIQGLLLDAGIPSVLQRSRGFDNPDFLVAGPHDVMVASGHAGRARELLAETVTAGETEAPPAAREASLLRLVIWAVAILAAATLLVWIVYRLS